MENNEGFALGFFKDFMSEQEKERRISDEEFQIRYKERKEQKAIMRQAVEAAARRICEAVERAVGDMETLPTPEALCVLSETLYHTATALQTAEGYAEAIPFRLGGYFGV